MRRTTTILSGQIHLYERQSEQWLQAHPDAQESRGVEEVVAFGSFIYARIKHIDAEWSAEMLADSREPEVADAQAVWNLYHDWWRRTEPNLHRADAIERNGYRIVGLEQYRQNYRDARLITSVTVERLRQAKESLRTGTLRSMGEVRDGLRRQMDARS